MNYKPFPPLLEGEYIQLNAKEAREINNTIQSMAEAIEKLEKELAGKNQ